MFVTHAAYSAFVFFRVRFFLCSVLELPVLTWCKHYGTYRGSKISSLKCWCIRQRPEPIRIFRPTATASAVLREPYELFRWSKYLTTFRYLYSKQVLAIKICRSEPVRLSVQILDHNTSRTPIHRLTPSVCITVFVQTNHPSKRAQRHT